MEVGRSQLDLLEVMIFIKKMETYISKNVRMVSLSLAEKDDKEHMEQVLLERLTYDSKWNTKLAILITSEQLKEESIGITGLVLFSDIGRKKGEAVDENRSLYFKYREDLWNLIIRDQNMQSYIVSGNSVNHSDNILLDRIILLNRGTEEQVTYLASMIIQGNDKLFGKIIDNEH
ncbi:hypothetical protein V6N13_014446 [Hibiscus sabdariffa]|uniref:TPM domain-containing protein n=1 Tax=Hibiscus sabdariffa TaxID=183260 RepID=A0ABR2RVW6_9ROSI